MTYGNLSKALRKHQSFRSPGRVPVTGSQTGLSSLQNFSVHGRTSSSADHALRG